MDATRRRALLEGLGLLLLIAGGLLVFGWRAQPAPLADDAFITFRYAEHWAAGHGVVFQPGERVEGYSNFLFLALLSAAARLGVSPITAAGWLNLAAALAVAVLIVVALPGRLRHSPARWPAAALWLASVHTQRNVVAGLETPVTALLALATALAVDHRRPLVAPLVALALALARPEGILFAGAAMVVALGLARIHDRSMRAPLIAWGGLFVVPYAAYCAWRVVYFGQLLPNSIAAKSGQPLRVGVVRSLDYLAPALATYWPLLVLVAVGVVVAAWRVRARAEKLPALARRVPWATWALTVAIIGPTVITGAGDPYVTFLRYLLPALPLLLELAVDAVVSLRLAPSTRHRTALALAAMALVAAVQAKLVVQLPADRSIERAATGLGSLLDPTLEPLADWGGLYAVAAWMVDNIDPDGLVATAEVGIVPYYTGLRVVDTFGLVDRHIAHRPGRPGAKSDPNYVFGRDPDVFVLKKVKRCVCGGISADAELFRDPRFRRRYTLVHAVSEGPISILIFARRDEERSRVVLDACADFDRDQGRRRAADGAPRMGRWLTVVGDHERLRQNVDRLQPVLHGRVPVDAEAAAWLDAWVDRWACVLDQRPTPAGSTLGLERRVAVPEHAVLRFSHGVTRAIPGASAPVTFRVEAIDAGAAVELYRRTLVPSTEPIWQDAAVDLAAVAGREITLRFRAERPVDDPTTVRSARWRDPRVVVEPPVEPSAEPSVETPPLPLSADRETP